MAETVVSCDVEIGSCDVGSFGGKEDCDDDAENSNSNQIVLHIKIDAWMKGGGCS